MQKGSIILKAVHSEEGEKKVTQYLQRHVKNISPDKVPELLLKLPVVLAREVPEVTARMVIAELRHLEAEAAYIPAVVAATKEKKGITDDVPRQEQRKNALTAKLTNYQKFNKELLIILTMVGLAWLLNDTLASQYLILGFYTVPAIMAAYYFGRRQAVLTALASILLVSIICLINPQRFESAHLAGMGGSNQWYHIVSWGSILLVTAYAMGTLYEKLQDKITELRRTYQGILFILRHFISQDEDTENHCFRVSVYAVRIASAFGLSEEVIEDIRSAALLHDLGKVPVNRAILSKAAYIITNNSSTTPPPEANAPVKTGPLKRILPMLASYGEGEEGIKDEQHEIDTRSIGAQIVSVADKYDSLVTHKLCGTNAPEKTARNIIAENKNNEFHPKVIDSFITTFDKGEMDIPQIII